MKRGTMRKRNRGNRGKRKRMQEEKRNKERGGQRQCGTEEQIATGKER